MTPRELQEFRRVSRRLCEKESFLKQMEQGFGLMVKRNKWKKPVMIVDEDMVHKFCAADLLEQATKDKLRWKMSKVGHCVYRRYMNKGKESNEDFAAQHQARHLGKDKVRRNLATTPLEWLRAQGSKGFIVIDEFEFEAGQKLCADYEMAYLQRRTNVDLSRLVVQEGRRCGNVPVGIPDHSIDAKRRLEKALDYVGSQLVDILVYACFYEIGLEEAERKMRWPRRSGKLVLKIALGRLAEFYGLAPPRQSRASHFIRATIE